jgi:hypothetical protein
LELKTDLKNEKSLLTVLQTRVNNSYSSYVQSKRDSLSANTISSRLKTLRVRQSERNKARSEIENIQTSITDLTANRGTTIIDEKNRINDLLSSKQQEKKILNEQINSKQKTLDRKNEGYENKTENYNGFAAHLEALSILTTEKPIIWWAKWLITLLFIFIEIAPVLFKLMAESGPYDDIMERIKHETNVLEKQKISDLNDNINTSIKISTEKNQIRLEAELLGNKALLEKIAFAQAEVAEIAVEKWKEEELKKLELGVNHIINNNEPKVEETIKKEEYK